MSVEVTPPKLIAFGKSCNAELEEIRDSVPQPPAVDEDVKELVHATSRLHVGFLFEAKGLPALQQICRFVLSADEYAGGWREFAASLGLEPLAVQCMRNSGSGNLIHVCELTLAAFAQREDASLDQVVLSLHRMNRVDAICQCKPLLLELAEAVEKETAPDDGAATEQLQSGLVMPRYLPEVSVIFKNLSTMQDVKKWPQRQTRECELEHFQQAVNIDAVSPASKPKEYAYFVMLTFTSDGADAARQIAKVFRQTYAPDGTRVGVVILQEHSFRINTYGSQYVLGFFNDFENVGVLDDPAMSKNTFIKKEVVIVKVWTYHIDKAIVEAGVEDKRLALEKRDVDDDDGVPFVTVIVDGGWNKRSYGHKYNANSGVVHYVVPVVTRGYVEAVQERAAPAIPIDPSSLDHKYVRFVYQQMMSEYLKNYCVNKRVRPVIVNDYVVQAQREFVLGDALFQAWCKESDVAQLAKALLSYVYPTAPAEHHS